MIRPNAACLFLAITLLALSCREREDQGSKSNPRENLFLDVRPANSPNLRFKTFSVLSNDLQRVLALSSSEICLELGKHNCLDDVHKLELGGIAPYASRIYEPERKTTTLAPIVWDRIVLSGCGVRARKDEVNPGEGALFTNALETAAGNWTDKGAAAAKEAINGLFRKALQRDGSDGELNRILALHEELHEQDAKESVVRWMRMSCYVVLTANEFLFQ